MQQYKKDFIDFMVRCGVLTFGDFTTKSGRKTPFFINTGNYDTGAMISGLGQYYAAALLDRLGPDFDTLYGPAYKGIPLCVTTASALHRDHQLERNFTFNRKEAKDHGEGGLFVGHKFQDGEKVVIVEDVITAGTAIRENLPLLKNAANLTIAAILVSVDRMERGQGELSAIQEVERDYKIPVFAIVSIAEIVDYLHNKEIDGKVIIDDSMKASIAAYRAKYGI